jgi:hypothetical protein
LKTIWNFGNNLEFKILAIDIYQKEFGFQHIAEKFWHLSLVLAKSKEITLDVMRTYDCEEKN